MVVIFSMLHISMQLQRCVTEGDKAHEYNPDPAHTAEQRAATQTIKMNETVFQEIAESRGGEVGSLQLAAKRRKVGRRQASGVRRQAEGRQWERSRRKSGIQGSYILEQVG